MSLSFPSLLWATFQMLADHRHAIITRLLPAYLLWSAAYAALTLVVHGRLTSEPLHAVFATISGPASPMVWTGIVAEIVLWLIFAPLLAVLWHRSVLTATAWRPTARQVVTYLGWLAVFVLLSTLISTAMTLVPAMTIASPETTLLTVLIWGNELILSWGLFRLGLVLPAVALGAVGYGLLASWKVTAPLAVALMGIVIVDVALWWIVNSFVQAADLWSEPFGLLVFLALWPLPVLLGLSVLTLLYRTSATPAADRTGAEPHAKIGR